MKIVSSKRLPRGLVLITLLVLVISWPGSTPVGGASEGPAYRFWQNYDLPVLMLWGTPQENGQRHGELFRSQIQHLINNVLKQKILGPQPKEMRASILAYLKGGIARLPADIVAELKGVAQGAGVSLEDIYLLNFFAESSLFPACSTIGIAGSLSRDKNSLIGHNLDWPHLSGVPTILLAYSTPGSIPYAALTIPGIPFPTLGCNQAGIFVTLNASYSTEPLPKDAQFILPRLRQALAQSDNLSIAEKTLTSSPRFHAWNVTLADAKERRLFNLELGLRHWSAQTPQHGFLISTNHLTTPALKKIAHPADPGSLQRYNRLFDLISAKEKIGVNDLENFLLDPMVWDETVYSAVWVPATLRLAVCPSPSRTYIPVDIGKILRSFPKAK